MANTGAVTCGERCRNSRPRTGTAFDPLFAETLAVPIDAEIAVPLSESLGKAQAQWQVYQQKLAEARRRDAQERAVDIANEGGWIGAR